MEKNTRDRLRRLASRYEAQVGRGRAEQLAARAVVRGSVRPRGRPVLAAIAGVAFTIVTVTAVGVAADQAVPGQILYPVDRAIEALGFDSDHLEERLDEAIVLADRGDRDRAIQAASEILEELGRTGVTVTLPTTTVPLVVVQPQNSTTTTASNDSGGATARAPVTTVAGSVVEAAPADDGVNAIKLAAEELLRTVRAAKSDPAAAEEIDRAAASLAMAASAATAVEPTSSTSSSTSSSMTSTTPAPSSSTTTTSTPSSTSSSTTTTIIEDETTGSTSTTVAGGGNGDGTGTGNGSGDGGGQPPITLPQP